MRVCVCVACIYASIAAPHRNHSSSCCFESVAAQAGLAPATVASPDHKTEGGVVGGYIQLGGAGGAGGGHGAMSYNQSWTANASYLPVQCANPVTHRPGKNPVARTHRIPSMCLLCYACTCTWAAADALPDVEGASVCRGLTSFLVPGVAIWPSPPSPSPVVCCWCGPHPRCPSVCCLLFVVCCCLCARVCMVSLAMHPSCLLVRGFEFTWWKMARRCSRPSAQPRTPCFARTASFGFIYLEVVLVIYTWR